MQTALLHHPIGVPDYLTTSYLWRNLGSYVVCPKPRNRLTVKSGTAGLSLRWLDKPILLASFTKIIAVIWGVTLLCREAVHCCERWLFQTGRACGRICLLPGGFINTNLAATETSLVCCCCAEPVLKCYLKRPLQMTVITRFRVAAFEYATMTLAPGFYEMLSLTNKTSHANDSFSRAQLAQGAGIHPVWPKQERESVNKSVGSQVNSSMCKLHTHILYK